MKPDRVTRRVLVAVAGAALAATLYIQFDRVLRIGRGSFDLGYDDVVYAHDGQALVLAARSNGIASALLHWLREPPHAPALELLSTLTYAILGSNQSNLYVGTTIALAVAAITISATFFTAWWHRLLGGALIVASPIGFLTIGEYRPDMLYTLLAVAACTSIIVGCCRRRMCTGGSDPLYAFVCLALMLVTKPSWIVMSIAIIIMVVAVVLIQNAAWRVSRAHGTRLLRDRHLMAVSSGFLLFTLIWGFWLGASTLDYLNHVLDQQFYVEPTAQVALKNTYDGGLAYIGSNSVVAAKSLLVFDLILIGIVGVLGLYSKTFFYRIALALGPLLPIATVVATTARAHHSSPFQGIFIYAMIMAILAMILWISVMRIKSTRLIGRSSEAIVLVVGVTCFATATWWTLAAPSPRTDSVPRAMAAPFHAEQGIAAMIERSCPARTVRTGAARPSSVFVAVINDMTWEGVSFYLNGSSKGDAIATFVAPPFDSTDPEYVARIAHGQDAVVLAKFDDLSNGVPLNTIQQASAEAIRSSGRFTEHLFGSRESPYLLFLSNERCPVQTSLT